MPDVHIYVNKPAGKSVPSLEDVADMVRGLEHVSGVRADQSGSVLAVSYVGGASEQQRIEQAIEEAGYELQRTSVRSDSPEG